MESATIRAWRRGKGRESRGFESETGGAEKSALFGKRVSISFLLDLAHWRPRPGGIAECEGGWDGLYRPRSKSLFRNGTFCWPF